MLKPHDFNPGENEKQHYYSYVNKDTNEVVQIIKNKNEDTWWGLYMQGERIFVIPEYRSDDEKLMLERICKWYNEGKNEKYSPESPESVNKSPFKMFLDCENAFGKIDRLLASRIQSYIEDPTVERWEDISGIIITSGFKTIWQAVCSIDSSFPRKGRSTDIKGNIISDWERIPDPFTVIRAIREVTRNQKVGI